MNRELKELAELAIRAALRAGEAIMEVYAGSEADWEVERKADDSPLTLADRRAHAVIAAALAGSPYPLLSEEGRHEPYENRKAWQRLWIVDPLDGTKEFLKRNGEFTVNIAFVENGLPALGVVYVPVARKLYWGIAGDGAYLCRQVPQQWQDEAPLAGCQVERLPVPQKREEFVVVASRSHLSAETETFIEKMRRRHGKVELLSAGSSLKLCLVAEGSADIYPRLAPTMEWDTAAGHAVVAAAGGTVCHAESGEPLEYNKEDLHNPDFIVRGQACGELDEADF